ncbi:MAG: N-acyl homoserine lactonase family protein [Chloroflexota bacterium]
MNVHAISTGHVKLTHNWHIGKGKGLMRLVNTLTDRRFTDWLPIYVWVIEHPEGLIVIDAGIPADANASVWFPPFMRLVQRAAPFKMTPEQEIGPQMEKLGLSPADVRWVILTHLHQDHEGGLHHFPNAEFFVSRTEWEAASGLKGRMGGYLNFRWPSWFNPTLIEFESRPYGPFDGYYMVTGRGDLVLVPTPGHSAGHLSVILHEQEQSLFFAGDVSYSDEFLLNHQFDGVGAQPDVHHETYARVLTYAGQQPLVYLPSHDPGAEYRLETRQTLQTSGSKITMLI